MKNQAHSELSRLLHEYRENLEEAIKTTEETKDNQEFIRSKERVKIYSGEIRKIKYRIRELQRVKDRKDHEKLLGWLASWAHGRYCKS